jgi:nicotinamide-nucleotide amidase
MKAISLSVGDELVLGQTVDTNSAWLSKELASIGWDVAEHITVGDDKAAVASAIVRAAAQCDVLLITGGLGPTKDDLTRDALAVVLGEPLEMNENWLQQMEERFRRLSRVMVESNRVQALIPRGARMIPNTAGTAAGIDADFRSPAAKRPCRIFSMPGVPKEMQSMFRLTIAPELVATGGGRVILSRTLHTFGVGESSIGEKLGDLMNRSRNPSVGTTVSGGIVSLRITARESTRAEAETRLEQTIAECHGVLSDLIFGEGEQTLQSVIADLLTRDGILRVSTAESCTGGLLAKILTDIPGSSRYFQRGWITYSNDAKIEMLGVDPQIIATHGAVSEEVVLAMSRSARQKSATDYALAISGIAGPDGGTPAKPVGTVCIALAHPSGQFARTFLFPGDREMIRDRSVKMAITLLRYQLNGKTIPF